MYSVQLQYLIFLLMLVDSLLVAASVLAAAHLHRAFALGGSLPASMTGLITFMILVMNFLLLKFGLYAERRPPSFTHAVQRIAAAVVLGLSSLGLLLFFLDSHDLPPVFLLEFAFCLFLFLSLERALLDCLLGVYLTKRLHCRRILIVGCNRRADLLAKVLARQRSWGHRLVGFLALEDSTASVMYGLPRLGTLNDLEKILTEQVVDEVCFALSDNGQDIRPHLDACERQGIAYRIVPALYDPAATHKLTAENVQGIPTLAKTMISFNPSGYIYKRILDYCLGVVGAGILLLIYPVIALAIVIDSPGPIFFKQPRAGRHGRVFDIYKFRTMHIDAEKQKVSLAAANELKGCIFKLSNDPRVTRVGRFLRKTSLDEFPQFINVLRGEMSIVGPRPHPVGEVEAYRTEHRRRLSVRPGITGLWQVSGRSNMKEFDDTVDLDLSYIDGWRFWDDILILLRTALVVVRGDGAH